MGPDASELGLGLGSPVSLGHGPIPCSQRSVTVDGNQLRGEERWLRESRREQLLEEGEHAPALRAARGRDGEHAFDEPAAPRGLGSLALSAPEDSRPNLLFGEVVGWLDALDLRKSEEVLADLEDAADEASCVLGG